MVSCRQRKPYFMLVFTYLWLWTSSCIQVKAANHTLKPGDSLNGTNQLCSENGYYCIGFVEQLGGLSYLTIISNIKNNTWEVWIANRNEPIFNNSGLLSLDQSGVLKIESQGGKPIILYSPPPQSTNNNSILATLLDIGNFVVQQLHPNGSTKSVLWQSFDYPTDCLLPGMKLGVNHKTGQNWSLVSWVSESFPGPGSFRLEWEPREHELIMRRQEQVIWKSGKLINNRFFEHIPEESQHIYQYNQVSNDDEDYFTFTTPNTKEPTKWALFETGELTGSEGKEIAGADMCYGYNNDRGCQKWKIPTCRNPGDVFESREGYPNTFGNDTSIEPNKSYGIGDCQASCWSKCSCVGFKSYDDSGGTGCIFFFGKTLDGVTLVSVGQKFNMLVPKPQHKGTNKWIWIGAAIATFLLIICSAILCLAIMKRKYMLKDKRRMETETQGLADSDGSTGVKDLEDNFSKGHDFKVFSYASVKEATTNFSSKNQLGEGGFGPVYKGVLPTGREVAVKRLAKTSGQGTVEFKNELMLICELQHMNLVKLLGCCIHGQERMLIYEYMPNKSLDFFLFDDTRSKLLDWQKRFNIIEGLSHGLLYLHKYSRLKIIHRDLKASNILLDENMNPKISDFGMARIFTQHQTIVNTNKIVGTYGYMSPEYVMEGSFSTKSDVYSYGVLLLEIVSGRMNNSSCDAADQLLNLVGHAWELWNDGVCLELMDPSLNDTFVLEEVHKCIHIGLLCVEHYAKDRPDMSDIISMLTNKTAPVTMPRRPAFYVGRQMGERGRSSKSIESNTFYTKEISDSSELESR
ncbi:PREDICTED: G-type lectin S-receptor-like serine/threonine-protein kinase CES101 [Lupinus angustifolius]|nr:PREDICTED: G-type lectin S-receptor-like serine/threonine-protein kinase CES101 [Lupinus angustifolius]